MKRIFFFLFLFFPAIAFSQNEVEPEGVKLLIGILIILLLPLLLYLLLRFRKQKVKTRPKNTFSFRWKKLKVSLGKNKKYRPDFLLLKIQNVTNRDVDIHAPVLCFRKLWSKRKFKLKGINRKEIYPLYLEKGKTHELQIDLKVFYQHDRKLKKFYWAKVKLKDTKGTKYSTKYTTLRKSLFS